MTAFTLDIYKDWTSNRLKERCRDLCMAVDNWQHIAMALAEHGKDGLTPSDREKVERLIEACRD